MQKVTITLKSGASVVWCVAELKVERQRYGTVTMTWTDLPGRMTITAPLNHADIVMMVAEEVEDEDEE
jgi:hypothetical protein